MKKLTLTLVLLAALVGTLGAPAQASSNVIYGCWQSYCDELCGGPGSGICVYSTCVCP
jgi:hypothetical protein